MEMGRVERLYVELTIKERKAKEFATFQETKALKAGDKVKRRLPRATLKQEVSRAVALLEDSKRQLDLRVGEKEKEHAKLLKQAVQGGH